MARKVLLYVWLLAVLLPTFSQWGTIAYFQVNKDYIARVLCQNRDKPQLHCDGHCFLAKKLKAQQEKQDQQTTERVQNLPVLQLFSQPLTRFDFGATTTFRVGKPHFHYFRQDYLAPLSVIVPPPCA